MPKGKGKSYRKHDPKERVFVDAFYTLFLKGWKFKNCRENIWYIQKKFLDIGPDESGNYSCRIDEYRMLEALVEVKAAAIFDASNETIYFLFCYLDFKNFLFGRKFYLKFRMKIYIWTKKKLF